MLHSSISLAINAAQALRGHTPLVVKPLRILALPLKPLRVFRGGAANHVQHRILFIMCPITGTIGPILFDKIADASSLNPCRVSIRAGMVTERKPRLVAGADHIGTDWQTTPAQLIGGGSAIKLGLPAIAGLATAFAWGCGCGIHFATLNGFRDCLPGSSGIP